MFKTSRPALHCSPDANFASARRLPQPRTASERRPNRGRNFRTSGKRETEFFFSTLLVSSSRCCQALRRQSFQRPKSAFVHLRVSKNPRFTHIRPIFQHKTSALHRVFQALCGSRGKHGTAKPDSRPDFQNSSFAQPGFGKPGHTPTLLIPATSSTFPLFRCELRVLRVCFYLSPHFS
jgi:hypothetical protein